MAESSPKAPRHFRELFRQTLLRMMLLYFLPLLLLGFFFNFQYRRIVTTSEHAHLAVIAEHQAHTLDLFLRERLVNLANVINDPLFRQSLETPGALRKQLVKLRQMSSAFVDIAIVDGEGKLVHYHGPVDFPRPVDYRNERWYLSLLSPTRQSVITDIYKGFRNRPHFTIAVKRISDGNVMILRAALSPERIAEFLTTIEGANEVNASVVNAAGTFQVVTPRVGQPLENSPYKLPARGQRQESDSSGDFAHAWLSEVPWALVVENTSRPKGGTLAWLPNKLLLSTFMLFMLVGVLMTFRARHLVKRQLRTERNQAELSGQLVQAAKLASVGELAAGIAHEINNPLAIIAEEIGLLKDSLDPEFADEDEEIDPEGAPGHHVSSRVPLPRHHTEAAQLRSKRERQDRRARFACDN